MKVRFVSLGIGLLLLSACGGSAAPASSAPSTAASPAAKASAPASGSPAAAAKPSSGASGSAAAAGSDAPYKSWDDLVAAAKKEGKVTLTVGAGGGPQARQVLPAAFKEDFGIDLEVLVSPSSQMVSRLKLERSSHQTTMDVTIGGADTMYLTMYTEKLIDPMKPVLLNPDVLNGANWVDGKPWFMDPEGESILRLSNGITGQTAVNTTMVKPEELASATDLLKPQYKGKIAVFDPTINGSGAQHAVYMQYKLGADFIKKLYVDQAPVHTQDNRQFADWVGRGNYPIAFGLNSANIEQAKKDGLPVMQLAPFKDVPPYLTAGSGLMALLKDRPHPAAAALFANWMALPKAQMLYNKAVAMASPLTTVKNDWMPDYVVPKPGVDYFDLYDWDYTTKTYPEIFEQIKKTIGD